MAHFGIRALLATSAVALVAPSVAAAGGSGERSPLDAALSRRVDSGLKFRSHRSGGKTYSYFQHDVAAVQLRRPLFHLRGKLLSLPMSRKTAERRLAAGKGVGLRVHDSSTFMTSADGIPATVGSSTPVTVVRDQAGVKAWFESVGRPALDKRDKQLHKDDVSSVQLELPLGLVPPPGKRSAGWEIPPG